MDSSIEEPLSRSIVTAVASRENLDPTELPEPLYEAIDPEALDALFKTNRGSITFEYLGYEVTVTGDADIDIVPLATNRSSVLSD